MVALSLCFVPLVAASLLAPEPVLYASRVFALGLVVGYVIVWLCNRDIPGRVRGAGTE
jgi:hypothetical protein